MRTVLALAVLGGVLIISEMSLAQPTEPPPRFGLIYKPRAYPQATPKQALTSIVDAAEKNDLSYVVAHLLDPEFIDARIADRARQFRPAVVAELTKIREVQKKNLAKVPADARVPDDGPVFDTLVAERTQDRAQKQVLRDIAEKLADDPDVLKDLRRFLRDGTLDEQTGRFTLTGVTDRAVFMKKIGDRWFLENRQADAPKAPEEKK